MSLITLGKCSICNSGRWAFGEVQPMDEDSRLSNRITMVGFTDSVDKFDANFRCCCRLVQLRSAKYLDRGAVLWVPVVTTDSGGSKETIVEGLPDSALRI